MPSDPKVYNVDHFTSTIHSSIPSDLAPEKVYLPAGFTVCIIGASKGIGEHIAYAFAKAHATNLVIASRNVADLDAVRQNTKAINGNVSIELAKCDIASAEDVKALAALVQERYGRLDIVIPNAAYAPPISLRIHEGDPEAVKRAFDVNVQGTYLVAHHFVPLLLSSTNSAKGFVAIGSIAACIRRGIIANTGYTISKMAQARLIEYLAEQYNDEGLVSICLHPGAVRTAMAEGNTPEEFMKYLTDDVGLCGAVCVWLAERLAREREQVSWLSGRMVSACWDMGELMGRREEVVGRDLLKFALLA